MDIRSIADGLANQTKMAAHDTLVYTRAATEKTAELVSETKKPINTLTDAGLALNRIAHDSVGSLIRFQHDAFVGLVEGGATRLRLAADASSPKELVDAQLALVPATRDRIASDLQRLLDIYAQAGRQTVGVFRETGQGLGIVDGASAAPKLKSKKKVKRTAKKAASRTAKKAGSAAGTAKKPVKRAVRKPVAKPAPKTEG